jgi:hypothetical protein
MWEPWSYDVECSNARTSTLIRMPEPLADKVFEAFRAILPTGVVMTKDRWTLSIEAEEVSGASPWQHSSIGYRGVHLTPLPFMSQTRRAEMGLGAFVATLAHLVSNVMSDQPWPAKDSKARVTILDDVVSIWFGPSGYSDAAVKLRQISWSGPLAV